jgi:hypothetical protein
MVARVVGTALLWGMRVSLAWLIAHEYLSVVSEKLTTISRALGAT